MIGVAAGILFSKHLNDGSVLVIKRAKTQTLPGKWHLPGGKLEWDESYEHALIREFKEELGIQIVKSAQIARVTCKFSHGEYDLHFFRIIGWIGTMVLDPATGEEYRWISIEQIDSIDWLPIDKEVTRLFLAECKHNGV